MANRYNQPAQGTTDWHIPLNENFSNLDDDVEIRDSEANLGNYTPATDAKFVATDTGAVYVGDGSSWTQLGVIDSGSGVSWTTTGPVTSDYTATSYEHVLVDASGGAVTVTAPPPSTSVVFAVKRVNASTNSVTIATPNSETIDGQPQQTVAGEYDSYTIYSNGSNYYIR